MPFSKPDPYRGVVIVLLALACLGTVAAAFGAMTLGNPVVLDAAVTLGLSTGILIGVASVQHARAKPPKSDVGLSRPVQVQEAAETPAPTPVSPSDADGVPAPHPTRLPVWLWRRFQELMKLGNVRDRTAAAGALAIGLVLLLDLPGNSPPLLVAGLAAALCLGAAGLTATAVRYLDDIDPAQLPEAPGLCRGARVVAWILVLAAVSIGVAWAGQLTVLRILHWVVLAVNAAVCYGLLASRSEDERAQTFPLDLGVLSTLGSRTNILGSVLDTAEQQLGIDLRSTWALTVVRHSVEPLIIGLCLIGWLSTSLTVVGVSEQGLVERLGVPVGGPPLEPGLHLHWPWPMDRVFRIPVQRVQVLTVGARRSGDR
jgi:hypothetical protein